MLCAQTLQTKISYRCVTYPHRHLKIRETLITLCTPSELCCHGQVREDLQAARTELLATVKTQGPCEGSGQVASSAQPEPTHKSPASVLHDNHAARSSMGAHPGPVGPLLQSVALCKPAPEGVHLPGQHPARLMNLSIQLSMLRHHHGLCACHRSGQHRHTLMTLAPLHMKTGLLS